MTSEELYNSFQWKEFVVGDIFNVEGGKGVPCKNGEDGNYPYISATTKNNGQLGTCNNPRHSKNCITMASDGNGLGTCFYQENAFSGQSINVITLKGKKFNKSIAIFLCACLEKVKVNYSYGKKLGIARLKKEIIYLPSKDGKPDYKAMEEYIILLDSEIIPEIGVPDLGKEEALLDSVDWDEFVVGDIFNIVRGKTLTKTNIIEGKLPFVTASSLNNGISSYIGNEMKVWNNAITVCSNGEPGVSFYHNYDFTASGDVCVLTNKNLNDKVGVFLCACLEKLKPKYSYGKKLGIKRLSEEIIHLPITDEGEINFKFMEEFMQSVSFYDIIKE